jgi:hypothetical protein
MASPDELFSHAYRDALQALDRNRLANEAELRVAEAADEKTPLPGPRAATTRAHRVLHEMYDTKIRGVLTTVASGRPDLSKQQPDRPEPDRPDPETVFGRGLRGLHQIEEFRSILTNLLEAVKRGDSLLNRLVAYRDLGLLETKRYTRCRLTRRTAHGTRASTPAAFCRRCCGGLPKPRSS